MHIIKRLWYKRWVLRSLLSTIYFNFHYLPFRQAVRLPILLYKPHFLDLKGKIIISGGVKTGMIELGRYKVSLYPNSGVVIENHGGTIVFEGRCSIGNNSFLSIGPMATVTFGKNFFCTTSMKLTSYQNITFEDNVLVGWDCLFMDTDFHCIKKKDGGKTKGVGTIKVGANSWICAKSSIMKNTELPRFTTVASGTMLDKKMDIPECTVIGNDNNVVVKHTGAYWDCNDDTVEYKMG